MSIKDRVENARNGNNPNVIYHFPSGWLVLADHQLLTGYCVLISDPLVQEITDLPKKQREQFLYDMTVAGQAIKDTTNAIRINYEILGNTDPYLHVHIIPRFSSESNELIKGPYWFYDRDKREEKIKDLWKYQELMNQIKKKIIDIY